MPRAYSLDLREKAVLAYEEGRGTQNEIAAQFGIGYRTLKEWLSRKRIRGDVRPKEHIHRGPLPIINEKGLLFIKQLVQKKPDMTISELRQSYANKFKVRVSQATMSKTLKKLNLRRKKKSEYASEQEREDVKKNAKNGKKK